MTYLSIVIPAIGSQPDLDETLLSVLENRPNDCEVVLVHPESYVDPYDLDDEVRLLEADGALSKASLFNAAINACHGEVIHLIAPGIRVTEGWCDAATSLFQENRNIGAISPLVRWKRKVVCGVQYDASRGKKLARNVSKPILAPLLGTGLYRASALRFMHGFSLSYGPLADVELGIRMQSAGYESAVAESGEIFVNKKPVFKPATGYVGGRSRSRLLRTAQSHGMANGFDGWLGFLREPLTNGLRPSTIPAMLGRAAAWLDKTPEPQIKSINDAPASRRKRVA